MNKIVDILSAYFAQILISLIILLIVGGGLGYVRLSQKIRHQGVTEYPDHFVPDSESYELLKSDAKR